MKIELGGLDWIGLDCLFGRGGKVLRYFIYFGWEVGWEVGGWLVWVWVMEIILSFGFWCAAPSIGRWFLSFFFFFSLFACNFGGGRSRVGREGKGGLYFFFCLR